MVRHMHRHDAPSRGFEIDLASRKLRNCDAITRRSSYQLSRAFDRLVWQRTLAQSTVSIMHEVTNSKAMANAALSAALVTWLTVDRPPIERDEFFLVPVLPTSVIYSYARKS